MTTIEIQKAIERRLPSILTSRISIQITQEWPTASDILVRGPFRTKMHMRIHHDNDTVELLPLR